MVKVKIIRDDEQHNYEHYLGQTYDAFIDNFEEGYCVDLKDKIWFVPKKCCEEIIDTKRVLLVEDGSVDIDYIENELGIKCIIYRQGSRKPEWLETGE